MSNKIFRAVALVGSPFLFIGYLVETSDRSLVDSSFTGFWGFMYITGWTFSMIGLKRINATGDGLWGRALLWLILVTLCVANVSNLYQWALPRDKPPFFFYIDLCWPLSNLLMTFVAIAVLRTGKLQGWKRYVPLFVALWLPVSIGSLVLMGKNDVSMMIGGVYSLIAWPILAICAANPYTSSPANGYRYKDTTFQTKI